MSTNDDNAVSPPNTDAVEQQGDYFLARFVRMINNLASSADVSIDVTLMVDGTLTRPGCS